MDIIAALDDPDLLGWAIRSPESFGTWRTILKSTFGLPMDADELELFRCYTDRQEAPTEPASVLWLVCGRRGGKSFTMALTAVYMAVFKTGRGS
jgi:hypothetical protein